MAKRMQEQKGDNRIVAKSKPTTMNLAFTVLHTFFDCEQSGCVEKPGDTQCSLGEQIGEIQENLTHETPITTKTSQG